MLQNKIFLKKDTHQYFDHDGNQYQSVSRVLDTIKEKFDEDKWSKIKAKQMGCSPEEVLAGWKKTAVHSQEHGTNVHDAIEKYTKYFEIDPGNEHLEPMLKSIAGDYKEYVRTYSECILYSPVFEKIKTRIAGTTDRLMIVDAKSKYIDIEDYKTNVQKGIQFYPQKKDGSFYPKYLFSPVDHLTDCNYHTYALQLSIYGAMAEELTGAKIRKLWIRFIPHDNPLAHYRIPLPYLKTDAYAVLNSYHNKQHMQMSYTDQPIFEV